MSFVCCFCFCLSLFFKPSFPTKRGGGVLNDSLEFAPVVDAGLGAVARRDIAEGDSLFVIPRKRIISEQTALADPGVEKVIGSLSLFRQFPSALLAFYLLLERQRNRISPWQAYIDVLPRTYSLPVYWSWSELLLLRGSPAWTAAHQQWKQFVRMFLLVHNLCGQHAKTLGLLKIPTFVQWRWALSAVFTRRNSIPTPDGAATLLALIPGWDMCNHQAGKITTFFDTERDAVVCTAMAATPAGQQACIFYGPRSNADLLVSNGFLASDAETNAHDYFPLRLALNPNDPLFEKKKEVLMQRKLAPTINYAVKKEFSPSSQCLLFARVARWTQAHSGEEVPLASCDPTKMISIENEKAACLLLTTALTVQLKRYPATDEPVEDPSSFHARCAIRLRQIEVDLVTTLLKLIESYASELLVK